MRLSISDNRKSRGRPVTTGTSPLIGVRLPQDLLEALDEFIQEQHPSISRPEAIRIVFRDWAIGHGYLPAPPEDSN
ncbi:ribbon-helix-helix domain-containing protein [Paradevosia shaoguanensis]|uniref:ribbon-helix-helix domain-containing protein n=1 Tax=Paradevosia shaoguanensis TaxID=1335043 RepID=UPI0019345B51|nr:ribbon-helix-helix domain-containing protein [Paradevosia shaoguanensis]